MNSAHIARRIQDTYDTKSFDHYDPLESISSYILHYCGRPTSQEELDAYIHISTKLMSAELLSQSYEYQYNQVDEDEKYEYLMLWNMQNDAVVRWLGILYSFFINNRLLAKSDLEQVLQEDV